MPDVFDQAFDDLHLSASSKYDYLYSPEWREPALQILVDPMEAAKVELILYQQDLRDGVKFSPQENERFRQMKLAQMGK